VTSDEVQVDGGNAPADTLKGEVTRDTDLPAPQDAVEIKKSPAHRSLVAAADIQEQNAKQSKQNTLWRRILFWGVSGIVFVLFLLEGISVGVYLAEGNFNPFVISTLLGATTVQILGLLFIITRHLFPGDKK
jgi:hypothetical protein